MLLQQHFYREVFRQGAFVPDGNAVVIDFHLNPSAGVQPVNEGVVYNLAQSCFRNLQRLRALHPFIPYIGNKVLGPKDLHNPVGHPDDVSLDNVLEEEVGFVADESANAEVNIAYKILGM